MIYTGGKEDIQNMKLEKKNNYVVFLDPLTQAFRPSGTLGFLDR